MIELPEAVTLARQITEELQGKCIARGVRGNSPHKFAFYSGEPDWYAQVLEAKTVGAARAHGVFILVDLEPGYTLVLGCGGERILLHPDETTLPKKHQLLLEFTDGTFLSVSVQGWGAAQLAPREKVATDTHAGPPRVSPLSDEFTLEYVQELFAEVPPGDPRSAKYFIISKPGIWGVGNGYLQDILFHARLDPRRRALDISPPEQGALYEAIRATLIAATEADGRTTERDLYNQPGRYVRILGSHSASRPCPECGASIEKISFLGGACYLCPHCQS